MYAILFLLISNLFMTAAWYGHLKWFKGLPMWQVILLSWLIALAEYCFQVPANRIGFTQEGFSMAQLKMMQEVITLVVFTVFSVTLLDQPLRWNHMVGFGFLAAGAFFVFNPWT